MTDDRQLPPWVEDRGDHLVLAPPELQTGHAVSRVVPWVTGGVGALFAVGVLARPDRTTGLVVLALAVLALGVGVGLLVRRRVGRRVASWRIDADGVHARYGNGTVDTTPWTRVAGTRTHTRGYDSGPQVHVWHVLQFLGEQERVLVEVGSSSGSGPEATAQLASLAARLHAAGWLPPTAGPDGPPTAGPDGA